MTKNSDISLSIWEHITELRSVLLKILLFAAFGMLLALCFHTKIFEILAYPYQELSNSKNSLVILTPFEGIATLLNTCFWIGLVGTSPFWLYFIYQFVAPALEVEHRRMVIPFVFLSLLSMVFGFFVAFYLTIPLANRYLMDINSHLGTNFWSLSEYVNYTVLLLFANGLAFELSVILFFLVHYGLISQKSLKRHRKFAIICIFILSAILTPPDVLTQVLLAIPLMIIYEGAILYSRFRPLA